jgi:4,5-dihydroxyphthalate decarboxylase
MKRIQLSFGTRVSERVRPLVDGRVQPQGIELIPTFAHPGETFWRQLRFGDFDVSEMSLSSLLIAKSQGSDLVAIPAFPSRRMFHLELDGRRDRISGPTDLRGRRVGVPEYQQTAALWLRGILQHDFGVHPTEIEWYMERGDALSHGGATGFTPPPGITLNAIPAERNLAGMLAAGDLDAALVRPNRSAGAKNVIERSAADSAKLDWSQVGSVFGDPFAEGKRFFDSHRFIPINHTYVIRGELFRQHPWIALNLYQAFLEAKSLVEADLVEEIPLSLVFRWEYLDQVREIFGPDPFPYGFNKNRTALQAIADYSFEQGLIAEPMNIESIFAPSTVAWESAAP